ncbi:O-antigen ligase [Bradyrhizobium sp. F1.4.3]|uniref:O-antigen ligase family protein n=1 Tax=Bradyrhizobium sp. F1.4.3 TaxID=3156356 RepID=UPI0033910E55
MKWVGLALVLGAIFPLSDWLRRNPLQAWKVWVLVGLMPFLMTVAHLVMAFTLLDGNPLSFYVHGAEFSVLDALAIAIFFSLPGRRLSLPFSFAMLLYFVAVLASSLQAIYPAATVFYAWQLARMFLVYAVVAKASVDPRVPSAILKGMAAALFAQAIVVMWQKFGLGLPQTSGTFDHQNILGLISHFIVFPFFALLLAGRGGRMAGAVVLCGAIIEVLTASRATIGLAGFGYAIVFLFSALRRWTSRKAVILAIGVTALAVLAPIAISSIEVRGPNELAGSDKARTAMEDAALLLISSHPLGVGANNYVLAANLYGANAAAGLDWSENSVFVHNAYFLVTAETGYPGLIALLLLLVRPIIVAFRCSMKHSHDARGDLLLGLGVALLIASIHGAFEWVFILDLTQYMLAISFGMVVGLARQLGYWGRPYALDLPLKVGGAPIQSKTMTGLIGQRGNEIP